MKFIRIGDEIIRLDLVTHIKEGCKEETLYGRSVRKTTDHRYGWLEVHFVSGEVIKIEGEAANVLRQILDDLVMGREPAPTPATRKHPPHEMAAREPVAARPEHAVRPTEEPRTAFRNGFGR
jgi:hypothetical protein